MIKRARRALEELPDETILAGLSMGGGVLSEVWAERPVTVGVLLLHATAEIPASVRPGLRI
ncbi:hypothetical protein [Actinomadura macra]|uniref:hypothetical protein n=1 Tax=Actinomadura macra TaxID=46164 RepID=UPI001C3F4748|nr:hypothetical protein [Actinomadura macra]